jgi:Na+-translocating ferredoxin:NAD+ oxidoreductase RNF subunit RnfB
VKSIRFSGNQAHIIGDECILCGQCFVVCPQNAKEIENETEKVKVLIQSGDPVVASIAPSFAALYRGVGIDAMREALKQLGFADAEETAVGATIVKTAYERILREEGRDILISSCCHAVNLLIQKHFGAELPFLANVLSPMQAHCNSIKKRFKKAKTVFIGPCVAKKDEAQRYEGIVDAVLTFENLTEWFKEKNIEPQKQSDSKAKSKARLFPTAGGILKTMAQDAPDYTYMAVDGVENCIAALKDIERGEIHRCFIEMSACAGSCIGGPIMEKYQRSNIRNYTAVSRYAGQEDFDTAQPPAAELSKNIGFIGGEAAQPNKQEIAAILRQMSKVKPEDELNCGSCGYNTCREKAVAIFQGKADISMCLPFLKERAENFSDNIVNNSPNGLVVLNENLEVQQINGAARKIMNIRAESDVLGEQVIRILDPKVFMDVRQSGRNVRNQKVYLAEYQRYVEQTVIHDKEYRLLICFMRDVTEDAVEKDKKESIRRQTVEIADKVVDKQMRIVQEIASLLGETAAETKIALSKLKETIRDE